MDGDKCGKEEEEGKSFLYVDGCQKAFCTMDLVAGV